MKTFPGEEVHSPGNGVHILSLAREHQGLVCQQDERVRRGGGQREGQAPGDAPRESEAPDRRLVCRLDKIRAAAASPSSRIPTGASHRQYIPTIVSDYLLETARFDAMVILNGGSSDWAPAL